MPAGRSTLRIGSRAPVTREPRQVRKEAAISAARRVPRIGLVRVGRLDGHADVPVDGGCTALTPSPIRAQVPSGQRAGIYQPTRRQRRWPDVGSPHFTLAGGDSTGQFPRWRGPIRNYHPTREWMREAEAETAWCPGYQSQGKYLRGSHGVRSRPTAIDAPARLHFEGGDRLSR